jgi:hypothetical protein
MSTVNGVVLNRVQNDTAPNEEFVTRNGEVVDLTTATVKLVIKSRTTDTVTNTGHQTCFITDPTHGKCEYEFDEDDLPDAGGDYDCDLQIIDSVGEETYYPIIKIHTRARTS